MPYAKYPTPPKMVAAATCPMGSGVSHWCRYADRQRGQGQGRCCWEQVMSHRLMARPLINLPLRSSPMLPMPTPSAHLPEHKRERRPQTVAKVWRSPHSRLLDKCPFFLTASPLRQRLPPAIDILLPSPPRPPQPLCSVQNNVPRPPSPSSAAIADPSHLDPTPRPYSLSQSPRFCNPSWNTLAPKPNAEKPRMFANSDMVVESSLCSRGRY